MNARGNIINEAVDVYLAATGSDIFNLSTWIELGWREDGKTRLYVEDVHTIEIKGRDYQISEKFIFDTTALEADYGKIVALEGLKNSVIDILLVSRNNYPTVYLISQFTFRFDPSFSYGLRKPKSLILSATRTAKKLSDVWQQGSLTRGFSNEGVDLYGGLHFEKGMQ